jgi:predicted phage terminase large subunit-like protein
MGTLEKAESSALFGLLMGVRKLRAVTIRKTAPGKHFIDFTVPGANTFFIRQLMTHNCDDVHSEQDVLSGNTEVFHKAYEWFAFGARTRLMPGGAVAIVGTRWSPADLIGRVVGDMAKNEGADQYEVFEFPAILTVNVTNPDTGAVTTKDKALWPEFFDLPALLRTKASMPAYQWNAQYQQKPTAEEAAIVKREWWRMWERDQPPPCDYIIASLDAAAETHNRADFTSLTLWGVFLNEEEDHHQLILLHAIKERLEFPELKKLALDIYRDWEPDSFIVEKKSAGVALYQELRRMGLPVTEYTPHRGSGDKTARLNSVSDIIASGMCWVPDRRWAEEVVEEIASFPFGANDDHVDSTVQALMRFRQGGFITLPTDEVDEPRYSLPMKEGYY